MAERLPRIAIFLSGIGSNMDAIIAACRDGTLRAAIALVASDNPESPGLARAESLGFNTIVSPYRKGVERTVSEQGFINALREHEIEWIVLAGFMRVLSGEFVRTFHGRIVNIHPSLLPAFPGAHALRDALEAGAGVTGVTVHIVDELIDHGPIIAQEEINILPGDTVETLSARVHAVEHRLYPATLQKLFHRQGRHLDETHPGGQARGLK